MEKDEEGQVVTILEQTGEVDAVRSDNPTARGRGGHGSFLDSKSRGRRGTKMKKGRVPRGTGPR